MSSALSTIMAVYDVSLQPISSLAAFGVTVTPIDVVGALRLALVLRQLREIFHREHIDKLKPTGGGTGGRPGKDRAEVESRARTRDLVTTLVMVYGGEAVVAPWLGIQPSFMLGGAIPATFIATHYLVEALPAVPMPGLYNELLCAVVDAFTRALLLCNVVPTVVTKHASPLISTSPWTLLITALFTANGGPFITNSLSLLQPHSITITTPPELLPWGWTGTDLWVAPLVTALYATLTHAQPFFTGLHSLLFSFFSPLGLAFLSFKSKGLNETGPNIGELQPVDSDTARAACVVVLGVLFVGRTLKNFGFQSPVYEESNEAAKDELVREARKGGEVSNRTPKKNSTNAGKKTKVQ